jgi:poly(A) polymerase
MPIITPAFPSMSATHTITHSTKDVLLTEFKRAEDMLGSILDGKRAWADLWRRSTFFTEDHRYYLSVIASARTKKQSDVFAGMVQAKLRHIVKGIDEGVDAIALARPFPEPKERVHRCEKEEQIEGITAGSLEFEVKKEDIEKEEAAAAVVSTGSNGEAAKEPFTIYTTTFYIGLTIAPVREGMSLLTYALFFSWSHIP